MKSDLVTFGPFAPADVTAVTARYGMQNHRNTSTGAGCDGVTAQPPKMPMCARARVCAHEIIVTAVTSLQPAWNIGFKVTARENHRNSAVTGWSAGGVL